MQYLKQSLGFFWKLNSKQKQYCNTVFSLSRQNSTQYFLTQQSSTLYFRTGKLAKNLVKHPGKTCRIDYSSSRVYIYIYIYIYIHTVPQYAKKIYRKYYIRNSDPGFPGFFLVFPYFSLDFPSILKNNPDPRRNLRISHHTADPYLN